MKNVILFFKNWCIRNLVLSILVMFLTYSVSTQVECQVGIYEFPIDQGSRNDCSKFYHIDYDEVLSLPIMETKVFFHFKANSNGINLTQGDPDLTVPQWEMAQNLSSYFFSIIINHLL